ncbi:hypothetical protein TH66_22345 [Carbonactinospora thermoautotrophica]|uniref:Histidine kinase/HSP90-like ATPase domain-containing protein n=1 Tax=Carbonactinospora thermoautotrophica TaxID=1469144 RepID=A0A132MKL6_9ACTN
MTRAQVFPGKPESVPAARRFVMSLLDGCPVRPDAELLVTETATNAIRHTRSGQPGGTFLVRVLLRPGWLVVAVIDQGGPLTVPARPGALDTEDGRGLRIVAKLANRWALDGDHTGRCAWFELVWDPADHDLLPN